MIFICTKTASKAESLKKKIQFDIKQAKEKYNEQKVLIIEKIFV